MVEIKNKLWEKYKQCNTNNLKINEKYIHSLSVMEKAVYLNKKHNLKLDDSKLSVAAILHDYAKFESMENFQKKILKYNIDSTIIAFPKVLHAFLGPYFILEELEIDDSIILDAIKYHSTGNEKMSVFSQVIFLADFIEDNRQGEQYRIVREVANFDLNKATAIELKNIIDRLEVTKNQLMPLTKCAYEWYKKYL